MGNESSVWISVSTLWITLWIELAFYQPRDFQSSFTLAVSASVSHYEPRLADAATVSVGTRIRSLQDLDENCLVCG